MRAKVQFKSKQRSKTKQPLVLINNQGKTNVRVVRVTLKPIKVYYRNATKNLTFY